MIPQGHSSDLLKELYGRVSPYQKILKACGSELIKQYPNPNLQKIFLVLDKRITTVAPLVFCSNLMFDLGHRVDSDDLASLGLLMLAITTHDDVVDEMPKYRVYLASLVFAGNIATNFAVCKLLQNGKVSASKVLLEAVSQNHYYQQHVMETLWVRKPKDFSEYKDGVTHISTFIAIGLKYALALSKRQDLEKKIMKFSEGYGIALQLLDDLRETAEDKINGYNSFPFFKHLDLAKGSIPAVWVRMQNLVDKFELFARNLTR